MPQRQSRLDATLFDRFSIRPGWTRTALFRRIAAGLLGIFAVVLFAQDAVATDHVLVVVAARDLTPGMRLEPGDVRLAEYSPSTVPDGALSDVAEVETHTVAGPVRAGEPLTDVRLLSSRLAAAAVEMADARIVPIRLTDAGVTGLLREGDTVDVLTVGEGDGERTAQILAARAVVVLVSPEDTKQRSGDPVVLVAMSSGDASSVAAASLVSSLTVTFH